MPKKNNKIDATFELIDDYDKKKQFFEDTILKLKQFNPPITPDAKTPRTSLRIKNQGNQSSSDQFDVSLIISQMQQLFDMNINLLSIVKDLNKKCHYLETKAFKSVPDLSEKIDKIQIDLDDLSEKSQKVNSNMTENNENIRKNENVNELKFKVINLEQKAVNNHVIFQGEQIDKIVKESITQNEPVDKFLKEHLKSIVPRDELNIVDSIKSIKIYGRQLKFLRTELDGVNEKRNLLVCLKKIKPNGIYVSEFLVRDKLNLFHQARLFAKNNRDKIEQVFTRNGIILCKDTNTKEVRIINSVEDLDYQS